MMGRIEGLPFPSGWRMQRQPKKRFQYSTGTERCLNKRVLVTSSTGFQDLERDGWEPMAFTEEELEWLEHKWMHIFIAERLKRKLQPRRYPKRPNSTDKWFWGGKAIC